MTHQPSLVRATLGKSEKGSGDSRIQYQFLPSESEGEVAVQVVINS